MSPSDYTGKNLKPWPVLLDHYNAGCIFYGAMTLYLFGKLIEAYAQGDYQKKEQ
jgi:hypothetical protein